MRLKKYRLSFEMMEPDDLLSKKAARRFCAEFMYAKEHYYAPRK